VEALPGVRASFASNFVPLSGGGGGGTLIVEGRAVPKEEQRGISVLAVTPHFNSTMSLPIVEGRDFTDAEGWSHSPVAVINKQMKNQFWPTGDVIGRRFKLDGPKEDWFTIIGVTPDFNLYGVDPGNDQAPAAAYVPFAYQQFLNTGLTIRVDGDPASVTSAVREAIRASDPNLPMAQVRTMAELRRLQFWQYGLYGWIFATTGIIGLLLAAIGVYGVLSYSVSQRAQEIGVRLALGAGRREILRLIVGQGVVLAAIGIVIGCVLAAAAMPAARSLLYKVSPFDPLTFSAVATFLAGIAFIASFLPARRAMRVDPVIALRGE
jgi:putative ABC transport system permease protein